MTAFRASFPSPFDIGDKVIIDDAKDMPAVVIGVRFHQHNTLIQVAWLHNGDNKEAWIEAFRLRSVGDS